ncbi:Nitrogen permease regulator 2 [Saccharomyces pastorianus]|uniref:Nitrogen permease regulator 2 n=1 Tax=Saccharomyces pastorianus TaxID=27292 RepID=A0A6C1E662_SACPS|nr:Nitrogen permease regulator 2 [Saccharomyces pastorianus]
MQSYFQGFVPIHTIFYSVFHPTEGSKIKYEFPPNNLKSHGINFNTIKNYIIPKPILCHKLITFKYGTYRIVCYPVTINSPIYARNFFSFNFVFVFPYDCETSPYEPAITRLGKMFKVLEEQNQLLSKSERDPVFFDLKAMENSSLTPSTAGPPATSNPSSNTTPTHPTSDKDAKDLRGNRFNGEKYNDIIKNLGLPESTFSIQDLLMRIFQDLNNYSECLIPIDDGNAVDIKIFPLLRPPTTCVSLEDVPLSSVNLKKIIDVNWDPTMMGIVPYIDGLNSIAKISKLSHSDPSLVIECIRHLIYYKCVTLSDIFQFSNIYAPSSLIRNFLTDPLMATDCQSYVTFPEISKLSNLPLNKNFDSVDQDLTSFSVRRKSKSSSVPSNVNSRTTSFSSISKVSQNSSLNSSFSSVSKDWRHSQTSCSSTNMHGINNRNQFLPTRSCLFDLYISLSQGQTLKSWYELKFTTFKENNIDIRRFITFGLERSIIYRCYSFPIMLHVGLRDTKEMTPITTKESSNEDKLLKKTDYNHSLSVTGSKSTTQTNNQKSERPSKVSFDMQRANSLATGKYKIPKLSDEEKKILENSVRSAENFDKICVLLGKSKQEVENYLSEMGEFRVINS